MVFDDNRLVSELYGEFDQNIALVEQRLDVHITPRGNHLMLMGSSAALDSARRVLESLYDLLEEGTKVEIGDVDATIRMVQNDDSRLPASSTRKSDRIRMARIATRKSTIGARTPAQDAYIRAFEANGLVFGIGPAGTGKTYLAVALAVAALKAKEVKKIVLARPAVEAGESLGFLPGDYREKIDPYLRPLYDALEEMLPKELIRKYTEQGSIEVIPLAYMRGRTLNNAFVILDEAQNATAMQMKMFLTRLGINSKAIVTGDVTQIDLPETTPSGLLEIQGILQNVEGIEFVYVDRGDVVRHRLVRDIIHAYARHAQQKKKED